MKIDSQTQCVRCELGFHTQNDNTASQKITHKEVMQELEYLKNKYGDGIIIELSGEAAEALKENMFKEKNAEANERLKKELEERSALLQSFLKPVQKLHRIIPNIKTNDKLEKSLEGADEKIVDAAYAVIKNNLLPHNIGDLTEDERQELISIGLEEAKYLAERLDAAKADTFMDAMSTIAKYGMNGEVDNKGNVTYDIRWGAMVGAPDDYISTGELMKKIAPEEYKYLQSMQDRAIKNKDLSLWQKASKFSIDWEINAYRKNPKPFEDLKQEQIKWLSNVNKTQLRNDYADTNKDNLQAFMDSIIDQRNNLNYEYLLNNLKLFINILT